MSTTVLQVSPIRTLSWVVLVIVITGLLAYLVNLPQHVGLDVPEGKLRSLSFAPFREGQGPLTGHFPTTTQMGEDLSLLSDKTHTIRTYASAEGNMPALAELAKQQGLTLLQGAWLGGIQTSKQRESNQLEINELIRAANAHPDVIKRVIVGNEVLLRGDLKAPELIEYIRQVKRAVKQPVSYADVWSEYMRNPELIKEVDFVTIHILPYWEDEPIAVEDAPAHIARMFKQVQQEAQKIKPDITILIGESGWPAQGRQRGKAIPSVVNEAKFIRGFIEVATANGFDYNIVEAFNQPWKSELEGVVGANWGLFSNDRQAVFPLTGDVYENPHWQQHLLWAVGFFVLAVGLLWPYLKRLPTLPLAVFLALLQWIMLLAVQQLQHNWYTSYSDWQRLVTIVLLLLSLGLGGLFLQRIYALWQKQTVPALAVQALNTAYLLLIIFVLFKTYQLAINGRYISFPTEVTVIPSLSYLGWLLSRKCSGQQQLSLFDGRGLLAGFSLKQPFLQGLGYALLVMSVVLIVGEISAFVVARDFIAAHPVASDRLWTAGMFTFGNAQLMAWLVSILVLALPLLRAEPHVTTQ